MGQLSKKFYKVSCLIDLYFSGIQNGQSVNSAFSPFGWVRPTSLTIQDLAKKIPKTNLLIACTVPMACFGFADRKATIVNTPKK